MRTVVPRLLRALWKVIWHCADVSDSSNFSLMVLGSQQPQQQFTDIQKRALPNGIQKNYTSIRFRLATVEILHPSEARRPRGCPTRCHEARADENLQAQHIRERERVPGYQHHDAPRKNLGQDLLSRRRLQGDEGESHFGGKSSAGSVKRRKMVDHSRHGGNQHIGARLYPLGVQRMAHEVRRESSRVNICFQSEGYRPSHVAWGQPWFQIQMNQT